jgi:hypothetical protein
LFVYGHFDADASLWLSPAEFGVAIAHRLGQPVTAPSPDGPTECAFCHTRVADAFGDHTLKCMHGGSRTMLHHSVVDTLHHLASHAMLHPQKEVSHVLMAEPNARFDVVLHTPSGTQLCDVAITHPLRNDATVAAACSQPGGASTLYERVKQARYAAAVAAENAAWPLLPQKVLAPLVVDVFGAWSDTARPLLAHVARALAKRRDTRAVAASALLLHELNFVLMRGIARRLLTNARPGEGANRRGSPALPGVCAAAAGAARSTS